MASTIYERIVEDIRQKINKGIYAPGEMIPSENSLCREYGASRITIRKSLALLAEGGFIYSVPGKGSFVRKPNNDFHILHFNEMDIIKGHVDKIVLLGVKIIVPTGELIRQLKINKNQKVVVIRRLFYSKKDPFAYDVKYLPYDKCKPIVEEVIQYATFPELVSLSTPLFSLRKELTIGAENAQGEEQKALKVEKGHSLLVVEQKLFSDEDKPVGWGKIYYRGEYCHLRAVSSFNERVVKA
ncbi:MAG: GntR family transcriptional regulator [Clostridiales bacterium]|nr:GntR family transcriptional regulator [Eubacteriales bacterium]MDH7566286.1 GntR family transcriptional regulator [Clostridiales bacterium]